MRFKGGVSDAQVQFATSVAPSPKITDLPAGKPTEITLAFPKGAQQFQGTFGWPGGRSRPEDPVLESVTLVQGGKSERLTF